VDAIDVSHLSKRYRLGETIARGSIREAIMSFGRPRGPSEEIWSLRDVSFTVPDGDSLGIIGRNGAGKSTMLKILSRITEPTEGVARMRGRVGSLLEVGTGFHPELTGRENVFLNGVILGMGRHEVARRFDEIVAFAGVERFIDTPIKRFSSGMQLRLAFAVAAHLEPDILVVDEVLAVGDAEFQQRCIGRMAAAGREGRTVVFVSHDMDAISRLCRRCLWLDHGSTRAEGPTSQIIDRYLSDAARHSGVAELDLVGRGPFRLHELAVVDEVGRPVETLHRERPFNVRVRFSLAEPVPAFDMAVYVANRRGVVVLDEAWSDHEAVRRLPAGDHSLTLEVPPVLNVGEFSIGVWAGTSYNDFLDERDLLTFRLEGSDGGRPSRAVCLGLPWRLGEGRPA
jgi:ABC-2 type transport system ATP-binding protein/lipopolysaccharide transport system ATP-binding protein